MQGESFAVDAIGTLAARTAHDAEATNFSYLATDVVGVANVQPGFTRFNADGATTDFLLDFIPDGQQSLEVIVAGVTQGPDKIHGSCNKHA